MAKPQKKFEIQKSKNVAEIIRRWSELPSDILWLIAACLKVRSDILHFRAVCRTWRKSAPLSLITGKNTILSPILPHNFSIKHFNDPMISIRSFLVNRRLVLVANSVFRVQSLVNPSFPPWLVSVEEFKPGKLYLRKPLKRSVFEHLPEGFPNNLDCSCFRVSEISRMYSLSYAPPPESNDMNDNKNRDSVRFEKVVLHVPDKCDSDAITIEDCTLMVLYSEHSIGSLGRVNFQDGGFSVLTLHSTKKFDDVVSFRGMVMAIDRRGRLYKLVSDRLVRIMFGEDTIGDGVASGLGSDRKKRLIESCGELYLVYRCPEYANVAFKVYKLKDDEEKKYWEELKGIGDDKILIATHDGCFFVPSIDMPMCGGNSLVFVRGVFPAYTVGYKADLELFSSGKETSFEIAVFYFGRGECKVLKRGCLNVLWPPPAWLSSDLHSSISTKELRNHVLWLSRDFCKDRKAEKDSLESSSCEGIQDGAPTACASPNDVQENLSDVGASDITLQTQPNTTATVQGCSSSNNAIAGCEVVTSKSHEIGIAKTEFQGVDVSSDLVPTLTAIWAKHGNILEGSNVKSNALVAWALDSIAKVVILLKDTSVVSLNNSQAEYLSSTLSDLQVMQFNVNWLAPAVAEALKFHKSMALKAEMEDTLKEIDKVTTHVADIKSKFLAELSGLEKTLHERRMKICESLSAFDRFSSGLYFGEGLF